MYPIMKISGVEIPMYMVFNALAVIALVIHNFLLLSKKKEILSLPSRLLCTTAGENENIRPTLFRRETTYAVIETIIVTAVQYYPLLPLGEWFGQWVNNGCQDYFGGAFFFPFIIVAFCLITKIEPLKQLDLYAPGYAIALSISKLGCFFGGCCAGMECSFGVYNQLFQKVMFPVQLVESAFALIIFLFLLRYSKKAKSGTVYPTYLILYSSTRFFSEFLRKEPDVIWHLKSYHIQCLVGVVVGVVELLLMLKFGEKITAFFEKNRDSYLIVEFIKDLKARKNNNKAKKKTNNSGKKKSAKR